MTTTSNISANAENYTNVPLADIQPSDYNPRKQFDEAYLNELADSIRQQGVLQPIRLRTLAENGRYEIVFGERRYKAALIAGLEEIPAVIASYTDEEAEEIAITENLQRKDVTPIEEANAYQRLIESGRHDIASLSILFGKCENYIRSRLKFTALIPEIAELMQNDSLSISVANEICRYGEDIQREVYEKHLNNAYGCNNWRGMKASEVANAIQRDFTTNLEHYGFDKSVCAMCPHNTNHLLLFNDGGCGKCTDRNCLNEKIVSHMVDETVRMTGENPLLSVCRTFNSNEETLKRLEEMGVEVEAVDYPTRYPQAPEAPQAEDFEVEEDYEEALKDYEADKERYDERCVELAQMLEDGEIVSYVIINSKDIALGYASTRSKGNGTSSNDKPSPIEAIEKKDKRNKEIAVERTIADTKKKILEVDMSDTKFSADEERMVYYFLLSSLRKENFASLGIGDSVTHLSESDKLKITTGLNARTKAIIRRDFLISNFQNAWRGNATATLLQDFAKKHMADELKAIEDGYNEVYEKRHQRLEEKKALLIAEQQKADTSETANESVDEEDKAGEDAA